MKRNILILFLLILSACSSQKELVGTYYEVESGDGKKWKTIGFIQDGFYDESGNQVIMMSDYRVTQVRYLKENSQVKK
jgi:hypothetical protein